MGTLGVIAIFLLVGAGVLLYYLFALIVVLIKLPKALRDAQNGVLYPRDDA